MLQLNEKTNLYENYGVWHVPFWQTPTFIVITKIIIVFIAALIIFLLYCAYRRYQKRKKIPAWTAALHALEALKKEQKVTVHSGKEFYLAVSFILKNYLHNRFKYDLLGKTDDEVVAYLEQCQIDATLTENIKQILHGGVVIKFANVAAAQEQIADDYARVITVIKSTIPQEKQK